ncbi:GAF domain-containing protein [Variovorax sp. ZT4R33]|uniref:GAF domain-containing protein n=1 Tax=Variovorax sp. ZT4R33 TaxID=3443743 RepID=UPI003F4666BC
MNTPTLLWPEPYLSGGPDELCVVTAEASFSAAEVSVPRAIGELLQVVRELLQLDVVFIGEIVKGRRVFRYIETLLDDPQIEVGGFDRLQNTICQRILDCRLPPLIPDVRAVVHAQDLPAHFKVVGTHIGVPVRLPDGRLYGMLCGFNLGGSNKLEARDVKRLEIAASTAARLLARADGGDLGHGDAGQV